MDQVEWLSTMLRKQAMLLLRLVGDRIAFYLRESKNGSPSW